MFLGRGQPPADEHAADARPRATEAGLRLERGVGGDEAAGGALELARANDPHDAIAGPLSSPLLAPFQTRLP